MIQRSVYGFTPESKSKVLNVIYGYGEIIKVKSGPVGSNWLHLLLGSKESARRLIAASPVTVEDLIIGIRPEMETTFQKTEPELKIQSNSSTQKIKNLQAVEEPHPTSAMNKFIHYIIGFPDSWLW